MLGDGVGGRLLSFAGVSGRGWGARPEVIFRPEKLGRAIVGKRKGEKKVEEVGCDGVVLTGMWFG